MEGGGGVSDWDRHLFDNYESSVVLLRSASGAGNGFFVFASGNTRLIMTCEHVVHGLPIGCTNILVSPSLPYFTGRRSKFATLLFVDAARDLALLRVDGVEWPFNIMVFYEAAPTNLGMDVILLSFFTMGSSFVLQPGTFAGKIVAPPTIHPEHPEREIVRSNHVSRPGTSGAPVFLARHNWVVGVNRGNDGRGMKYAISIPTIKAALRGWLHIADENTTIMNMLTRITV